MGHHLKMLCVEDNNELRLSLSQQFTAEEFEVDTAEDGEAGLKMMKEKMYDIVLLDMKMPKMDGLTVLKEMKQYSHFPSVIMLTAIDDVSLAIKCVSLGAKDYISKPYDPEELLHVVIKTLGKRNS